MHSQLLQQLSTVQHFVSTLFDSLPPLASLPPLESLSLEEDSQASLSGLISQNIQYGRKIIELSDKFTAKYRRDHFVDRRDVEEKVSRIYRLVCRESGNADLDEMVTAVLARLEEMAQGQAEGVYSASQSNFRAPSRASVNALNFGSKESKIEEAEGDYERYSATNDYRLLAQINRNKQDERMSKSKILLENLALQPSQADMNEGSKRKKSLMGKSKVSKKSVGPKEKQEESTFTTKNVLHIKTFFEQQQLCIRKVLQKFNKIIQQESSHSSINNYLRVSKSIVQYTKCTNDTDKDNIKDFVQANIENNKFNLNKVIDLVDVLQEHWAKSNRGETYAQGKFNTYIEQINKRQEVFSFAVSKLLENISNLKDIHVKKSRGDAIQIIESLEQISNNFYDLYPSHSTLKHLKIENAEGNDFQSPLSQKQLQKRGFRNQEIQVNISSKNQKNTSRESAETKRNTLQLYKMSSRINEMLQKFERAHKFKKNVEAKQVEKFIETIRESFPKKNSGLSAQIVKEVSSYQQELKKIVESNQKNQRQLSEEFNKKVKKYERNISDLEKAIEQLVIENKSQSEKAQKNIAKVNKKLESEREQTKKIIVSKQILQKTVKQMGEDLSKVQKQIKEQYEKYENTRKTLLTENKLLQQKVLHLQQQIAQVRRANDSELQKMAQQRQIYHQKIIFLQTQQQSKNQQNSQLKYQLEQMIKQNTVCKKQVQEMTEVYEEKIKELQELIHTFKQQEDEIKAKTMEIIQLKERVKISEETMEVLQREKNIINGHLGKIAEKLKQKQVEAQKYKQLGVLNDEDINILREQMQKVKEAYEQSEEQLEQVRQYCTQLQSQKQLLVRENKNYRKQLQSHSEKSQTNQFSVDKLEKQLREVQDDLRIKKKQTLSLSQTVEEYKKEISKMKRELNELRQANTKFESEVRNARQQLQKRTQTQSLQSGKRKLQLEAARVELRRKTEQLEKMKESYEQKLQLLESKNKELNQFITQKQLLAKITNSHLSQ